MNATSGSLGVADVRCSVLVDARDKEVSEVSFISLTSEGREVGRYCH